MIEDNGGFGKPRERRDLGKLMVILPGLEGQALQRQLAKASAEVLAAIEARGWVGMGISHLRAGIEAGRMANASKARRRREAGIKHRPHALPEAKVRKAHNSRRHSRFPMAPLALMAAMPFTNSVSPTGRRASGPSARNTCRRTQCGPC